MSSLARADSEIGSNDRNSLLALSNDDFSVIMEGEIEESRRSTFGEVPHGLIVGGEKQEEDKFGGETSESVHSSSDLE